MQPFHQISTTRTGPVCLLAIALFLVTISPLAAQSPEEPPQDRQRRQSFEDSAVMTADFQQPDSLEAPAMTDFEDGLSNAFSEGLDLLNFDGEGTWYSRLEQQLGDVDFTRLAGSLAIVLGGYFGFVWLTRRLGGGASRNLPQEVVEVLGQSPFGPKKTLQLVRLGSKLLLLIHSSEGTQLAGEINDPHEVEYLVSLCCGKKTNRSAISIRKASTGSTPQPTTDLRKILRQLQGAQEDNSPGSVFEA